MEEEFKACGSSWYSDENFGELSPEQRLMREPPSQRTVPTASYSASSFHDVRIEDVLLGSHARFNWLGHNKKNGLGMLRIAGIPTAPILHVRTADACTRTQLAEWAPSIWPRWCVCCMSLTARQGRKPRFLFFHQTFLLPRKRRIVQRSFTWSAMDWAAELTASACLARC